MAKTLTIKKTKEGFILESDGFSPDDAIAALDKVKDSVKKHKEDIKAKDADEDYEDTNEHCPKDVFVDMFKKKIGEDLSEKEIETMQALLIACGDNTDLKKALAAASAKLIDKLRKNWKPCKITTKLANHLSERGASKTDISFIAKLADAQEDVDLLWDLAKITHNFLGKKED